MFNNQIELIEERRNDIITIKEGYIKFFITLLLKNKKPVINK